MSASVSDQIVLPAAGALAGPGRAGITRVLFVKFVDFRPAASHIAPTSTQQLNTSNA